MNPQFENNQIVPDAASASDDALIFDVSTTTFEKDVMAASMHVPVIVDFWAPWCGPCRQLGPALEQEIQKAQGKIKMAKVNIDENPELAQALQIQSVPMVFAFVKGQPVDAFVGVKSQTEIKSFFDQIIMRMQKDNPNALDIPALLEEAAMALSNETPEQAQRLYVEILSQDEHNIQAYIGLIRAFIMSGQEDNAQEMINEAPDGIKKDSQFAAVLTAMELAKNRDSFNPNDLAALKTESARNPDNHQVRFDLSCALFAAGEKEQAIEEMLMIIRQDRTWNDNKAREQLLKFFEALGFSDAAAIEGRKKLSSILFS